MMHRDSESRGQRWVHGGEGRHPGADIRVNRPTLACRRFNTGSGASSDLCELTWSCGSKCTADCRLFTGVSAHYSRRSDMEDTPIGSNPLSDNPAKTLQRASYG